MRVTKQNKRKKRGKEIVIHKKILLKFWNRKETAAWQAFGNSFWESEQAEIVLIGVQYRALLIKVQEE